MSPFSSLQTPSCQILDWRRAEYASAAEHGSRMLPKDGVATNPLVAFSVERFEATSDFQPTEAFVSRLLWRAAGERNSQSKLMLSDAEDLIATALCGNTATVEGP